MKLVQSAIVTTMLLACIAPPLFAQVEGEHIGVSIAHPVAAIQDTETPAQRDVRMAWWRDARFGMFIHWGLYSIPAGTWDGKQIPGIGEWIMNNGDHSGGGLQGIRVAVQSDVIQRCTTSSPSPSRRG